MQTNTNNATIASYQSNALGERTMASYPTSERQQTRYYLYDKQQRIAELDEAGNVVQQYLYVNQTPVAVINTPTIKQDKNPAGIIALHTDRRHAPMMATDEKGNIIWQAEYDAWGKLIQTNHQQQSNAKQGSQFNMNLRLPGQWQDAATGLYYNYQRDYNPDTGRYLTPDPLGFPDGPDAYAYVGYDPLNKVDPLGLYQSDIHYYMTYFLSVMAGLNEDQALIVAMGAQYIDDNPYTWPLDESGNLLDTATAFVGDIDGAIKRLESYHFVQTGNDDPFKEPGEYGFTYEQRRIKNPQSAQLKRLLAAANANYKGAPCKTIKEQLFGEYLHAFQDTFGHRNQLNQPIGVNLGLGHAAYGKQTDKTYKDIVLVDKGYIKGIGNWYNRPLRTLEMEEEVFEKVQENFDVTAKDKVTGEKINFDDIALILKAFNETVETEQNTNELFIGSTKLTILNAFLKLKGFNSIPTYNITKACEARQNTIVDIAGTSPPGLILGTPLNCPTHRGEMTQ